MPQTRCEAPTACPARSVSRKVKLPRTTVARRKKKRQGLELSPCRTGADDRDRTGDLHLGKVTLYQLSHIRMHRPSGILEVEEARV